MRLFLSVPTALLLTAINSFVLSAAVCKCAALLLLLPSPLLLVLSLERPLCAARVGRAWTQPPPLLTTFRSFCTRLRDDPLEYTSRLCYASEYKGKGDRMTQSVLRNTTD